LPCASGRLWQSWRQLALPQLLSLADLRSLPDLRVVRLLPVRGAGASAAQRLSTTSRAAIRAHRRR
jgi:hypothetical protein